MDDDEDKEFSKSIVYNYFEQAKTTFTDMDKAFDTHDLQALSRLGHFLKGSSAALGLSKVKISCEMIQNHGNSYDAAGKEVISKDEAFMRIKDLLSSVKQQYQEAETFLRRYYGENVADAAWDYSIKHTSKGGIQNI